MDYVSNGTIYLFSSELVSKQNEKLWNNYLFY